MPSAAARSDSGWDVGRVDLGAVEQPLFGEQDGERVGLLARGAARDPHLQRRVGDQVRHDGLADGAEVAGVAEQVAHLHGQEAQQLREGGAVVLDPRRQRAQASLTEVIERDDESPLQRGGGVAAEVVVIRSEHGFEEGLELAVGRRGRAHFGIHTRTSDSSLSMSRGLAM